MNQAIAYIRISDKDQSNFSLEGQEKYIREHCNRKGIHLLQSFIDDGRSAKNFDRSDWRKLETFIQQYHKQINYLVVVKYDRFSRNAAQGLQKIEWLERKYQIVIMSVFEEMFIDYDSPFFFKQRADMLVAAEFELHVIRDRTKFGMHHALSTGRFVSMAPVGYTNGRDENNKPILTINEEKAPIIRTIYHQYLAGHTFAFIAAEARQQGLKIYVRTAVPYILQNPTYAGMVKVFAYRKDPAKIINGIHPAIIDKETWYAVQKKLSYKENPKTQAAEEVPLRAQVAHICGKPLTAGKSKGRRQYFWYYKCNVCPRTNYSAIIMHKKFSELLNQLSFTEAQVQYIIAQAEKQMQQQLAEKTEQLVTIKKQYTIAIQTLESLEEKFILNQIKQDTYEKFYYRYSEDVARLQNKITTLQNTDKQYWEKFHAGLHRLKNVEWLWQQATLMQKHEFIRMVFNSSLMYDGIIYRTPYIMQLFKHNLVALKQKDLLLITEAGPLIPETSGSAPTHTPIEHLTPFLNLIASIKTA